MKKYKSHKIVEASEIKKVIPIDDHETILKLEDKESLTVDKNYIYKHGPYIGGYYVKYSDGYESFSPKEDFKDEYTEYVENEASEKNRCLDWLQYAREKGETDMRQVINWINSGDTAPDNG